MTDSVDQNSKAWARQLLLMTIVGHHLDSDSEISGFGNLWAEMRIPHDYSGRSELMVRVCRCIEVMDTDGMRHQQEFVFLSQVMVKLEAGEAFNQLFSNPF